MPPAFGLHAVLVECALISIKRRAGNIRHHDAMGIAQFYLN